MKKHVTLILIFSAVLMLCGCCSPLTSPPLQFVKLFNGCDLSGWININTDEDTWCVSEGILKCTGKPIGVLCTDRQYENFILQLEWKHLEAGGNSGVFLWSDSVPPKGQRLPRGIEVQILELDWAALHNQTDDYVHGEIFGVGREIVPDNPRGTRSKSFEKRCKEKKIWNKYTMVCIDGVIKLSVNGKFVNGISKASVKKGYICLESEGAEIHFRNIHIMELPPGITSAENTAPVISKMK